MIFKLWHKLLTKYMFSRIVPWIGMVRPNLVEICQNSFRILIMTPPRVNRTIEVMDFCKFVNWMVGLVTWPALKTILFHLQNNIIWSNQCNDGSFQPLIEVHHSNPGLFHCSDHDCMRKETYTQAKATWMDDWLED